MRQLIDKFWVNSQTPNHFMRQLNSQTLKWFLILNLKMLLGNCLRKCCWNVPKSMSLQILLISQSHTVTGRFGPARGILTWIVSAWVVKGSFLHFSLFFFFTKLNTCPSVHPYTYYIAYFITFRLGQNNQRPKWLTLKIGRNETPTKSETTHSLNLDLLLSFTVLRSES